MMQLLPRAKNVPVVPVGRHPSATDLRLLPIAESKAEAEDSSTEEEEEDDDFAETGVKALGPASLGACPPYHACFVTTDLTTMRWLVAASNHVRRVSPESILREVSDTVIFLSGLYRTLNQARTKTENRTRIYALPEYPYPHSTKKSPAMERTKHLPTALFYWYRTIVRRFSAAIFFRAGIPGITPVCPVDSQLHESAFISNAINHVQLMLWLYDHEGFPKNLSIEPWLTLLACCAQMAALHGTSAKRLTPDQWLQGLHQCNLLLDQINNGPCVSKELKSAMFAYYCYRVGHVYDQEGYDATAAVAYERAARMAPLGDDKKQSAYRTHYENYCAKHGHVLDPKVEPELPISWKTRFLTDQAVPRLPHDRKLLFIQFDKFDEHWFPELVLSQVGDVSDSR